MLRGAKCCENRISNLRDGLPLKGIWYQSFDVLCRKLSLGEKIDTNSHQDARLLDCATGLVQRAKPAPLSVPRDAVLGSVVRT